MWTVDNRPSSLRQQHKEYEAGQARRDKLRKARTGTFERIIEESPTSFSPEQLRMFFRLLVNINLYDFLEEVASHFASNDENTQQSDEDVVLAVFSNTTDEKLISFALHVVLSNHVGIPRDNEPDLLTEAANLFAPKKPRVVKPRKAMPSNAKPSAVKAAPKKTATKKAA